MSDADAHGDETGEVVEGASHDSATLASAFEAAVREDRRDTDLAFEVMQERATEGGLNATLGTSSSLNVGSNGMYVHMSHGDCHRDQ